MTAESQIAKAFRLDDEGWSRHANPWSGWTRILTCLPLLALAIWSRTWLGLWSLIPISLAILWIWLNPRAFSGAQDDSAWVTKAVIGERFWTNRHQQPVPERHRLIPHILNIASLLGFPLLTWGLITLQIWPTAMGIFLITGAKLWYLDRMVVLYQDMVSTDPQLAYRRPVDVADTQSIHRNA